MLSMRRSFIAAICLSSVVAAAGCTSMDANLGSTPSGSGATDAQVAQWQLASESGAKKWAPNEQDELLCSEFGYKPNTRDYARCRENLHNKRLESEQAKATQRAAAEQAAAANQAAIASAIIAQGPPKMPPLYTPQIPQQTYQPVPPVKLRQPVTTTCSQDPVLKGNVTCTSQ